MDLLAKSAPDRLVQLGCFMFDSMVQNVGLESIRVLKHQQCRALKMAYPHVFVVKFPEKNPYGTFISVEGSGQLLQNFMHWIRYDDRPTFWDITQTKR